MIDWGASHGAVLSLCELVRVTSVPASSVHHYLRLGLIPAPRRSGSRYEYDERHIAALRAVRSLRRRGLALDEIRSSLPALLAPATATEGSAIDAELLEQVADASPAARLVDAALRGFSTHGFDEMSVATLCSDAGVAKATFYRCFGSKDALFVAAANAAVERAVAGFTAEMAGGESTDHAAIFARHLRASLPVLLELAKRTTQEPAATVGATVSLFAELADRVGRATGCDGDAERVAQVGGLVIVMAVVKIFDGLLRGQPSTEFSGPDRARPADRVQE